VGKRTVFALLAVLAAVLTTLEALSPVTRAVSMISSDLYYTLRTVFLHHSLVALGVGIGLICVAIFLSERQRLVAIILLVLAPVAAFVVGLAL
jgi:hypothetical protein